MLTARRREQLAKFIDRFRVRLRRLHHAAGFNGPIAETIQSAAELQPFALGAAEIVRPKLPASAVHHPAIEQERGAHPRLASVHPEAAGALPADCRAAETESGRGRVRRENDHVQTLSIFPAIGACVALPRFDDLNR